jgi:hypothetical protein
MCVTAATVAIGLRPTRHRQGQYQLEPVLINQFRTAEAIGLYVFVTLIIYLQ